MIYTEYSREDWVGPVRGPLWCAMTWLIPMVLMGDEDPDEVVSGLSYLSRLAMHVIPDLAGFRVWLEGCAIRLAQQYPQQPISAFTDLFGELSEARRGPYVAREALDLSRPYVPDSSSALMQGFLQTVDPDRNPLLRSAADLIDIGYQGVPYGAPIPWPPVK